MLKVVLTRWLLVFKIFLPNDVMSSSETEHVSFQDRKSMEKNTSFVLEILYSRLALAVDLKDWSVYWIRS